MHAVRPVRYLVDPIIEVTRPLPPLAFIPLFIEWFGIGEMPKVVLILVGVLPIMVIATLAALDSVPLELELCARTLGASRRYTLSHVQVRAAIPGIVTGMRIAMAGSWTSIVAAGDDRGDLGGGLPHPSGRQLPAHQLGFLRHHLYRDNGPPARRLLAATAPLDRPQPPLAGVY